MPAGAGEAQPPSAQSFDSAELNAIYDYWLAKRGRRRMPSRQDIDPIKIPKLLPNLMLIDVSYEPIKFRYRLVGTRVVDATGENRAGKDFDTVDFIKSNPTVMEQYIAIVTTGEPLHSLEPFHRRDTGQPYEVDRLLLPLSSDGVTVDMILVYFRFKSGAYAVR
jgi:hypothetical protein